LFHTRYTRCRRSFTYDVGSVDEAEEIEEGDGRYDVEIDFPS
jgi:hypothetical protein